LSEFFLASLVSAFASAAGLFLPSRLWISTSRPVSKRRSRSDPDAQ
jgi:hypothetical protein